MKKKTIRGYFRKRNRTSKQIYNDFVYKVHFRRIYKDRYTEKQSLLLLSELSKMYKNKTLLATSLRDIEKQYCI